MVQQVQSNVSPSLRHFGKGKRAVQVRCRQVATGNFLDQSDEPVIGLITRNLPALGTLAYMLLNPLLLLDREQTQGERPEFFLTRVNRNRVDQNTGSSLELDSLEPAHLGDVACDRCAL